MVKYVNWFYIKVGFRRRDNLPILPSFRANQGDTVGNALNATNRLMDIDVKPDETQMNVRIVKTSTFNGAVTATVGAAVEREEDESPLVERRNGLTQTTAV